MLSVRKSIANLLILILAAPATMAARLEISAVNGAQVGHPVTIVVSVDSLDFEISGYNLLLAVDQSSYVVKYVAPGQFFDDCEWEYFSYRIIYDSAQYYELGKFTDLLNVRAFASVTSGFVPQCYSAGSTFDLAQIEVLLGYGYPGHWLDCQWMPIRFYWRDCNDNVLYSRNSDTVYTAAELFEYGYPDTVSYEFPGFGVPDPPCPDPPGQVAVNSLSLCNGGIDVFCLMWPLKGDVNLNSIHYELADLQLFVNYWLWGMIIFVRDPGWQLDQCDVDYDGYVTVTDLVLFVRIIIGDIPPIIPSARSEDAPQARVSVTASERKTQFGLDAFEDIGAVYSRFVSDNGQVLTPSDVSFSGPTFTMGYIGDTITMLLVDLEGGIVIPAGSHQFFELASTDIRLVDIQLVDRNGYPFKVEFALLTLPTNFALQQNYPNPFNPTTTIEFNLPVATDWSLFIYNVAGQLVKEFTGQNQGAVEISWDGRDADGQEVASGIYLYRLDAGDFSATRKMLLLK